MVEAMVAELNRQAADGRPGPYVDDGISKIDPEPDFNAIKIDGDIDLEKVARAGLEALSPPEADVLDLIARVIFVKVDNTLHAPEAPSIQAAAREVMPRVIDAILGEKP